MQLSNLRNPFLSAKSAVKGSALMITAVVVMAMVTVSAVLLNDVIVHTRLVDNYEDNYQVRYAADAGLEQVKYEVEISGYTGSQNTWLLSNSSTAGFLAFDNLTIGSVLVDVVITDLTGGRYRATSTAEINQAKYSVIMEIVGNNAYTFPTGYAFLNNTAYTNNMFGVNYAPTSDDIRTMVEGNMHSNNDIYFVSSGPYAVHNISGNLTSARYIDDYGERYLGRAPSYRYGAIQEFAPVVPWQEVNIASSTLASSAEGDYRVTPSNPTYGSAGNWTGTTVTLLGDQVQISTSKGINKILPLPANGLIYIDGPTWTNIGRPGDPDDDTKYTHSVTLNGGTVKGRLTIATPDAVTLSGSVKYVDNEGDPAYRINQGGTIVTSTATGVIWTEKYGTVYEPNPDYNPATPNSFGLLAGTVVGYAWSPYNLEFHGSIWCPSAREMDYTGFPADGVEGRVLFYDFYNYADHDTGNFALFGSIVAKGLIRSGVHYGNFIGYGLSQRFYYDPNIDTNPPPFFAPIPTYAFTSWRRN